MNKYDELSIDRIPTQVIYTYCLSLPEWYCMPLVPGIKFKDENGNEWILSDIKPDRSIILRDPIDSNKRHVQITLRPEHPAYRLTEKSILTRVWTQTEISQHRERLQNQFVDFDVFIDVDLYNNHLIVRGDDIPDDLKIKHIHGHPIEYKRDK